MKILVASDIHGSSKNCERLVAAFWREEADQLLLLGDLLAHGQAEESTAAVIEMLNGLKERILCVRGNGDWESDQNRLAFPCLEEWKVLRLAGRTFFVTHGHLYNEHSLPPLPFDVLLHGHTHVPTLREHADYVYLNPGAVSRPRNGSVNGYLLLDEAEVCWKDLAGELLRSYRLPG